MNVTYIGNFGPAHSTENHVARALENIGCGVTRLQENEWLQWNRRPMELPDFVLWTRTGWDWTAYGFENNDQALNAQWSMLSQMRRVGVPVVGFHLDIWWGLKREHQVEEPFFAVDLLATADGGHDEEWAKRLINHVWMPPGVSLAETEPGMYRSDLASPLAFVGSWSGGYHQESAHRHELVGWLQRNFTRDCAFWPRPGDPAIRGADLRDLYTSVDVLVGDSCFTGTGLERYWSDRIPETVGRGGYLLHPYVEGMVEQGFTSETMGTWTAFDWEALGTQIEWALSHPDERKEIARDGREMVRAEHTYERRMEQLVELLYERKLLKRPARARKTVK